MSTKRATRASLWFWFFLILTVYVVLSAGLAVTTSDRCDGHFGGERSWVVFPPHWECSSGPFD
jgi:hypothetical protein